MESIEREPGAQPRAEGSQFRLFVSVSPGLEELLADELRELGLSPRVVAGGVEVKGGFDVLIRLHLWSRLAESVRVRLKAFHATDFQTLEAELSRLPWHAYLRPELGTHFSVTCHKSRLYHSDAVAERCRRAIESRLKAKLMIVPRAAAAQVVALRLMQDEVQPSIDASGERLHRRGYRTHVSDAPMRETLAAALVRLARPESAAGEPVVLWDPFCGSGTLTLEWLSARLELAPGARRGFAFESWPIFTPRQSSFDRERARAREPAAAPGPVRAIACDVDEKALAASADNARRLGVFEHVHWVHGDFEHALSLLQSRALVLANPPYGKRLGKDAALSRLYHRFERVLAEQAELRPAVLACGLKGVRFDLPWQRVTEIAHGGLRVPLLRLDC